MQNDPISEKYRGARGTLALPSEALRDTTSIADLARWLVIGEAWSHMAAATSRVSDPFYVDVGCGCGKMARFLSVDHGCRYLGLDVYQPSIEWSQAAFAGRDSFQFVHLDVVSPHYNEGGTLEPETVVLPCDTGVADVVICASLFTHLLEPVFRHYMMEVARMLSPVGRALVSIHNEPRDGRFSGDVPRIDIAEDYFVEIVEQSGLRVVERVGFVLGQIVFILGHPDDPGIAT
jgi:SAM-dependent methyltransferase